MLKILNVDGVKVRAYTIQDLAERLGRSPLTVRSWERQGYIPPPFLHQQRGKTVWRLYTVDEIEALVLIATGEGIGTGIPMNTTKFSQRAKTRFDEIARDLRYRIEQVKRRKKTAPNTPQELEPEKKFTPDFINKLLGLGPAIPRNQCEE